MDELMRHQPSLKQAATAAIIKLLEQVCARNYRVNKNSVLLGNQNFRQFVLKNYYICLCLASRFGATKFGFPRVPTFFLNTLYYGLIFLSF